MISFLNFLPSNFVVNNITGKTFKYMDETEELIMEKLFNIYLSRFRYTDLPEEMEETIGSFNYFDSVLFFNPSGCFCKTAKYGIQYLPTTGSYKFNVIGRPIEWNAYGYNGFNEKFTYKDSVLMFNDNACTIPFLHLFYECKFMRELDNISRQNIRSQIQPFLIEGDDDVKKSMQTYYEQLTEFKPVIFTKQKNKKDMEPVETKVFQTGIEYHVKDYLGSYTEFFNRCLTYMGISNIGVDDKRERLVVSEATSNDILIQTNYTAALEQRETAVKKANAMFGTHIKVEPTKMSTLMSVVTSEYQDALTNGQNGGDSDDADSGNVSNSKNAQSAQL